MCFMTIDDTVMQKFRGENILYTQSNSIIFINPLVVLSGKEDGAIAMCMHARDFLKSQSFLNLDHAAPTILVRCELRSNQFC